MHVKYNCYQLLKYTIDPYEYSITDVT